MGKYSISLRGNRELRLMLGKSPLPSEAQERIIRQGFGLILPVVKARAPGSLASAISAVIERQPDGRIGRVRVADRSRKGFRYHLALHTSKKRKYHYRSGPRLGRPTRSWFQGPNVVPKQLGEAFEHEVDAYAAKWGR